MGMQRVRRLGAIVALIGLAAWLAAASALERLSGGNVTLPRTRTVANDLVAAGGTLLIEGTVEGDVVAAGGDLTVPGPVRGDVIAAGGSVVVSGDVGDDVRAAGGSVSISGSVADTAALAGGNVVLHPGARIGRDASLAGGSVRSQGRVERNLSIQARDAVITGEVGGSVEARVQQLTLQPGRLVRGDLTVYSPNSPRISPEARVLGTVDHRLVPVPPRAALRFTWLARLIPFLWVFVIGATVLAISTPWAGRVSETILHRPGMSILAGFLTRAIVPVVSVLLLVTVIGLPLGFILMALYLVALCLASAFVACLVGSSVLAALRLGAVSPYARLMIGALLVSVAIALPVAGWLFQGVILVVGLGGLILERRERWLHLRAEEVV
jgi:cytoskeletal protein CcmA (bactofilin family)